MNNLQIFNNPEFGQVRTVTIDGEPWLCLADICSALEIRNVSQVKTRLSEDGVITNEVIDSLGRKQKANFINESNMYKLIFQSRKESAERFTDWVTSEVLPAIRKTGHYEAPGYTPKATSVGEVVNLIKVTRQTMKEQRATPTEIATAVKQICEQFGVELPDCFIKPKETTMADVMQMIDFIYAQPRGRGHKRPTYDDFIIYQANLKRLGD